MEKLNILNLVSPYTNDWNPQLKDRLKVEGFEQWEPHHLVDSVLYFDYNKVNLVDDANILPASEKLVVFLKVHPAAIMRLEHLSETNHLVEVSGENGHPQGCIFFPFRLAEQVKLHTPNHISLVLDWCNEAPLTTDLDCIQKTASKNLKNIIDLTNVDIKVVSANKLGKYHYNTWIGYLLHEDIFVPSRFHSRLPRKRFLFLAGGKPTPHRQVSGLHILHQNMSRYFHMSLTHPKGNSLAAGIDGVADILKYIDRHVEYSGLDLTQTLENILAGDPLPTLTPPDVVSLATPEAEDALRPACLSSDIHLIPESAYDSSNAVFITEKTMRAIYHGKPFIMLGRQGDLKYLRDMGLKTFHPHIDESYDDEENPHKRLHMVLQEVERICQMDKESYLVFIERLNNIAHRNYNFYAKGGMRKYIHSMYRQLMGNI